MSYVLREKLKVGVSACNFGAQVRWNHRGWDRIAPLGREKDCFIWTPVCPEVQAGLGVPRAPLRLTGDNGHQVWQGQARLKNRSGQDVTDKLKQGMTVAMDTLKAAGVEAFVFMEGSPSCGVYRTTLKNNRLGKPPGAFGSLLLQERLFLIPALDLQSPVKWWDWRRRLLAFAWLTRQQITSKKQIIDIWSKFKFVCQELDRAEAERIGHMVASMPKELDQQFIENWRDAVLMLLRRPSTIKRIYSMLQKHFAHYRKQLYGLKEAPSTIPDTQQGKTRFINQLQKMEQQAYEAGLDFVASPVIFRDRD